ncbi:DNA-binding response regulator, OmpR family, contains REC and winged-helix (wHTH) domain [Pedobacter steynii]|uniref:DNA-binding response regulator, OmpR family, contains REC and winged-helix (WHTH) domain n=1 Tax=Pedobacter steynii TaxID=430522 RepID=A0A1G9SI64_9SPHI|nr:response regulator transcription factor [Pedobacter steynii]NQX37409.1 response regulator transcription factor [Pedobacter steynii]SDM35119.1 DNA-binding response regulator, OmpR family, contains REC and winged-helix (wHTH) domain [Pedobacter steynii]
MFKIGLAEDDLKIAGLVKTGLEEQGYLVTIVSNGEEALQTFKETDFNLVILDVMMPGMNGIAVCKSLRSGNKDLPILMLTALGSIDDKVTGLNSGADDYLVKPFHFKELLARIEALLRRQHVATGKDKTDHLLSFDDISLNTYSKEVKRAGILIELTAKEHTLLELFLRNPNRLLSRQYIAENAWDISFDTGTNVIDVYVNFLRNKIEKGFSRKLIHTKIGMGYILK